MADTASHLNREIETLVEETVLRVLERESLEDRVMGEAIRNSLKGEILNQNEERDLISFLNK